MPDENYYNIGDSGANKLVESFIEKAVGHSADQISRVLAEKIRSCQSINEVKILTKVDAHLKEKKIKTKTISLKTLASLLEKSSLEEEASLQDKWAALLTNTVSEGTDLDSPVFANILGELTKRDAELFERLCERFSMIDFMNSATTGMVINKRVNVNDVLDMNEELRLSLDNLVRLRLIKEDNPFGSETTNVGLTNLGYNFVNACKFPAAK